LNLHFPNDAFLYQIRPWEAGDRIRHGRFNNIFVDLFTIRRYESFIDFEKVVSYKANGQEQSAAYIQHILHTVQQAAFSQDEKLPLLPFYHFDTRKAIELWSKEVYRHVELFPLNRTFKMGPLDQIQGPHMPILLLKRAFGHDCFHVYYQSVSHTDSNSVTTTSAYSTGNQNDKEKDNESFVAQHSIEEPATTTTTTTTKVESPLRQQQEQQQQQHLPPHVWVAGTWQDSQKVALQPHHYIPLQPTLRAARRPTLHNLHALELYLQEQSLLEATWMKLQLQEQQREHDQQLEQQRGVTRKTTTTPSAPTTSSSDKELFDYSVSKSSNDKTDKCFDVETCGNETKGSAVVVDRPTRVPANRWIGHHDENDTGTLFSTNDSDNPQPSLGQSYRQQQGQSRRPPPRRTVYMDGVFDLFHIGHLNAIRQCAALGDLVIIGVTGDADATQYKRPPIISQCDRADIVKALAEVHDVICPCPLIVTRDFMKQHNIDLVVHGFCNEEDAARQKEFFAVPMQLGQFQQISYYHGLSTTDIMNKIIVQNETYCTNIVDEENTSNDNGAGALRRRKESLPLSKPQWFGATIAAFTDNAGEIPYDPFPLDLRQAIEPHIHKALQKNQESMDAIRQATGDDVYNAVLANFSTSGLAREVDFEFDTSRYCILTSFLAAMDLPPTFQLGSLHHCHNDDFDNSITKDRLLYRLSQNWSSIQLVYDEFVRGVCIPHLSSTMRHNQRQNDNKDDTVDDDSFYYQSFPCVRVIQPNEFSIGPHADVAYGHHPCTINFYLPLTEIGGTSALFLESRPGSQDWHPIQGSYGM
jgi:cytidyltransferase-like protein